MKRFLIIFFCLVLLTGCWDQRDFKDIKLGIAAAYDLDEEGRFMDTILIPNYQKSNQGPGEEATQFVTAIANTPSQARELIDSRLSNTYDSAQLDALLFGEKLAKTDIYPYIDAFYRDPRLHLDCTLALVKGEAKSALETAPNSEIRQSEYIEGILQSKVDTTNSLEVNMAMIASELFEEGEDFLLPAVKQDKANKSIEFYGLALFNGAAYTGKDIAFKDTTLCLLLKGMKGRTARITMKISDDQALNVNNYATISIYKMKHKIKTKMDGAGKVSTDIYLNLDATIEEFPEDDLTLGKSREAQKKMESALTDQANTIIRQLQEANSDVFGIGRKLRAYHPRAWEKMDWEKDYPEITIVPHIKLQIQARGVYH